VPVKIARRLQFRLPVDILESFTDPSVLPVDVEIKNSVVTREPVGVVGAITPWNHPLYQVLAKIGAALAAGCTVVLKPSEVTPVVIHLLADVLDHAGLPQVSSTW
jgi:aldehyde dehydrogenase (NAD+)